MNCRCRLIPIAVLFCVASVVTPSARADTLVVCAPGYPGSTAEAGPAMDAFAAAVAGAAGWTPEELAAVYFETEAAGVANLGKEETTFAMVTLPFFLEYRETLGLKPLAQAVPVGSDATQHWSLVAAVSRVSKPKDLRNWQIISLGGHSPSFVRAMVFDGWGPAPEGLEIVFSARVLTALRRAAKGENVAVLLDGPQAESLGRLPFGKDLEILRTGPEVPVSLVCSVGGRPSSNREKTLAEALLGLGGGSDEALAGIRIERFVPVDAPVLGRTIEAFDRSHE
jgi:hypothetical protein